MIVLAARECGLPVADETCYSVIVSEARLRAGLALNGSEVRGRIEPGDVLLFRIGGAATHVGLCTGACLIHAYGPAGRVCEHDLTEKWRRRIAAVYRWRG